MQLILLTAIGVISLFSAGTANAQSVAARQVALAKSLQDVYVYWRQAMITKNHSAWKQITASHRQLAIQNRVFSEKGQWPGDVFKLPTAPPPLNGLKLLRARSKGVTAKSVYFGKIDFGIGGKPTENLLVLSFVYEGRGWKYDTAEFINLSNLKDVRAKIKAGDLSYVDGTAFLPTGVKPPRPIIVPRVKYIAKIYTYCPGREVKARVNKISQHRFQDTQQSEVVIGGARDGMNELWYSIKDLPGYKGDDPMTVRIYLMSQIPGVKPIKVYQYQTKKGEKPKAQGSVMFRVDAATGAKVLGRGR
ncbi:MAG: hypothetical protein KJO79_03300 [Verrucomicrobiae bacterium]|nr:hypothetical protein [Verrucomicrobiae bacterium]NNJ86183.1 hypothetical protein [Akkermansiaceae bacterium]